ncbi:M1 family peptidase [Pedobacter frigiditerrae]|uniref:M1 family peptidase n=1 Tax=Pedobacter frigiditerrae TaxID=2530452 RepID=A0A4R0N131_9SPHI|nr:M1 family metallopeptidase [Pedobacter frigiditerrae]TCC93478.1 M1 family peptidase [Pedobacter frigiditerrae]
MKTSSTLSKNIYLFAFIFLITLSANAQLLVEKAEYGRADSLRGYLSPMRSCYDINYYHLDLKIDIDKKAISGSNEFKFTATRDFTKLQFDLFANFKVEKVIYKGKSLTFKREINAVFVNFPLVKKGSKNSFTVYYSGNPTIAKRAPWDGGFVFAKDVAGKPFIATACQGVGASIWWPNKDHQADEVDSMLISISVPKGLKDISNGRLRKTTELKDGYTRFDWFVSNPINNYDVALNVGDFVHFDDIYEGEKGKLTLDYWVLPENLEKAKVQFAANVKPMLKSFEYWFGPYPFYEDGYKLVESPHLGMEHQSAVAYGNKYQNGYLGRDMSTTGIGLKWDFIIVHESGHEWFGNNITSKDLADMWIHESFTNYSESLFTESMFGKQAGQEYIEGTRKAILNQAPVQGIYNVNREGSGDMYPKGGNLLNMVRTVINDDEKWRSILRGLNKEFYHSTVNAEDVIGYINKQSGKDFTKVFDQYLKHTNLPILEIRVLDGKATARWIADVKGFDMPVRLKVKGGDFKFYNLTTAFKPIELAGATKDNIEVDFNYYIGKLFY